MIIRHDIDPERYLTSPGQFLAVITLSTSQVPVQIAYDPIDQLLKPSLIPMVQMVQTAPEYYTCCNGMGVLIRSNWIVSAAHIAVDLSLDQAIRFDGGGEGAIAIKKIVLHPQFKNATSEQTLSKNDIALLQLNRPAQNISPLPLYQGESELHHQAVLVGRGDFGNGLIGPDQVDGKLRMATNQIEEADEQWLRLRFDAPPETTDLEGIAGPGDGGSPALLATHQGWALAGIRSTQASGSLGEGYYGVWEYYTRLSKYLLWIESVVSSDDGSDLNSQIHH
ncbi:MAG: hypothetical protein DCF15_15365 [Phormidesmis priestleyi]|uniref:Peptidase S1 domain-containing protein n=1 Tax=Phormidesmis priestleyi TaxID=268141 RepID=A0A2W4X0K9_9CYAN|nr:MAG: hypothetical protein DCF15_15365 [Phormidesmis priestleyi]